MKRRLLFGGVAMTLAFGCAEIYGLGDYTEADGSVGSDTGADVEASVYDVTPPSDGGCAGQCVPNIPSGWTMIAYDRAFQPACSPGYGNSTDVHEGMIANAANCQCGCSFTAQPCTSLTVTSGDGGTNTCNNHSTQTVTWDGGCTTLTTINASNEKVSVTPSGTGVCAGDASASSIPAITYGYDGRLCEVTAAGPGACSVGTCVPAAAPYAVCVYQTGIVACPSDYPVPHIVGTKVVDTRGCTGCGCTVDAGSCSGTATLYSGGTCTTGAQAVTADGTCQSVANAPYKTLTYARTTTTTCTPSSVSAIGDAGFADPRTVCCAQ